MVRGFILTGYPSWGVPVLFVIALTVISAVGAFIGCYRNGLRSEWGENDATPELPAEDS